MDTSPGSFGSRRLARALALAACCLSGVACKTTVATPAECDAVARHVAELRVQKEKRPPLGRLAAAPFNTKENEDAVFEEARDSAKARCTKGWKREVYECVLAAKDLEAADKCRSL